MTASSCRSPALVAIQSRNLAQSCDPELILTAESVRRCGGGDAQNVADGRCWGRTAAQNGTSARLPFSFTSLHRGGREVLERLPSWLARDRNVALNFDG